MIDTPQVTTTSFQQTAVIHLTIPRNEIQSVMGPGIGELMATVAAQGIALAGLTRRVSKTAAASPSRRRPRYRMTGSMLRPRA